MTLLFVQGFAKNLLEDWQKDLMDFAFINQKIQTNSSSSYPLYSEELKLIGNPEFINEVPSPVPLELNDVIEISSHKIRKELVKQKQRFCVTSTALFSNDIQMGYCKAVPIKS